MKRIIPKIERVRDPQTGQLVPGVVARDPRTRQRLPAEGIVVDRVDAFWRRRASEGGVTIVDEPAPDQAAPAPAPTPPDSAPANAPPPAVDSVTPTQPAPAPAPKE
jgi:hypothetical protein